MGMSILPNARMHSPNNLSPPAMVDASAWIAIAEPARVALMVLVGGVCVCGVVDDDAGACYVRLVVWRWRFRYCGMSQ